MKKKKLTKYLDLEEMYQLSYTKDISKPLKYNLALKKFDSFETFSTNESTIFENFLMTLKQYCILPDFSKDYDLLNLIGSGFFAKVYRVRSKLSKQIFAAKVFNKTEENFSLLKVNNFYIINLFLMLYY